MRYPARRLAAVVAALVAVSCGVTTRPDPTSACGDGVLGPGEVCDDGNGAGGDGCSRSCVTESGGGERCADGIDDDGDELADCDDPDCARDRACVVAEDCDDGDDDDGDQFVDCEDPDCLGHLGCWLSETCDDGADNDGDGRVDCTDPDCADLPACDGVERCEGGADEDGDGAFDCDDSDCATDPACADPEVCDDGADNDRDGRTDCRDSDCAGFAGCAGPCGDGRVGVGEDCDDGPANSDVEPDACRTTCVAPRCGDGVTDAGERCDGEEDCTPFCTLFPFCDPSAAEPCDGDPVLTSVAVVRDDLRPREIRVSVGGIDTGRDLVEVTLDFFDPEGRSMFGDGPASIDVASLTGRDAVRWTGDSFRLQVPVEWTSTRTWGVSVGEITLSDRVGRSSEPMVFLFSATVGPGEECDPLGGAPVCGPGFVCDEEREACAVDPGDPCAGVPVLDLDEDAVFVEGLGLVVTFDTTDLGDLVHPDCARGGRVADAGEVAVHWRATQRVRVVATTSGLTALDTLLYAHVGLCVTDLPAACDDDTGGPQSLVVVDVDQDDDLWLHIDSFGSGGPGQVSVRFVSLVPPGGACDPDGVTSACDSGAVCVDGICHLE